MNKEIFDHIFEYRKWLEDMADFALILDAEEIIDWPLYTDEDLMNACIIFMHISWNVVCAKCLNDWLPHELSVMKATKFWKDFKKLIMEYAWKDMAEIARKWKKQ